MSHEYLIGKRMELYVAIGDDFRTCDFHFWAHILQQQQTNCFTAREKKVINLDATANFQNSNNRISNTVKNMYEQVSLISVKLMESECPSVQSKGSIRSQIKTKINSLR